MSKNIYGVDIDKKITPLMVRDAILKCFIAAHKEILDLMDEFAEWKNDEEREKYRKMQVELIIKNTFNDSKVDYDNPTKEGLIMVINNLAKYASMFRKPDVIKKHYNEIMMLIERL
ncbi:MAG: hypothetical protein V1648_00130 [Candidatus Aenigmatarchaeota archaeon]